jgi:16S rRNA U1498 N3-methylase RsmE
MNKIYKMKKGDCLEMTKEQLLEWKSKIETPLKKEIKILKFFNVQNERTLMQTRMDLLEVLERKGTKDFRIFKRKFNLTKKEMFDK